jgi:polynucleotide 5'-kinase involved in rRNA processing
MSLDWPDKTAQQLLDRGLLSAKGGGICLILGAVDTGKTTLAIALAKRLAARQPVGIIDADVGQSHIGPPATVGWAVIDNPQVELSQLPVAGIAFVGDVTPVGHLLQMTGGIAQGAAALSTVTELIIIDTPGLIRGPAAAALWWTVYQIIRPALILAVQRSDELSDILVGLKTFSCRLEQIRCPLDIPVKSPPERRRYRQSQFNRYFRDSRLHNINMSEVAVQASCRLSSAQRRVEGGNPAINCGAKYLAPKFIWGFSHCGFTADLVNRLVGLRDEKGGDVAIGVITDVQQDGKIIVVKAPPLDVGQIRCLVIGDITADIAGAAG